MNTNSALSGKNAVITGGSDGIGYGIAEEFAHQGANLFLIARTPTKLAEASARLSEYPVTVHTFAADLTDISEVNRAAEHALDILGSIDVLVNNAGIARFIPFEQTDENTFDEHFNLNVKAPYFLAQKLLPELAKNSGNIVNISSYFSKRMLPGRPSTVYSMTKGALNLFTQSLAFEAGSTGVRVNAIAPGMVETPQLLRNVSTMPPEAQEQMKQNASALIPLGRIGNVADIGRAAAFLASDAAEWVTGAVLSVDGGITTH